MLFMSAGHSLQGHPSTLSTVAGDRWREVLRLRAIISRNCFVYPVCNLSDSLHASRLRVTDAEGLKNADDQEVQPKICHAE